MDDSSASTSADPLTLPSSPLGRHVSPRKANLGPRRSRSPAKQQFTSPSKSFIMDTGDGGNEQSPWRIKVTVQAEPREGGSPGKKPATKTTTIPLKGGSSSPAKRPARRRKAAGPEDSEVDAGVKRPQRKRKGTPMHRAPKRLTPVRLAQEEEDVSGDADPAVAVVSSPTKKQPKRGKRMSLSAMQTQRGQRLSQARDELDEALQDAVGGDDEYHNDEDLPFSEAPQGDMTAMNEDFTMISVETLQSMKQNTSMLEDSQIGDKSAVNGSYWPSSPPETQERSQIGFETDGSSKEVDYPNISAEAQNARDTPAKSFAKAFDAMSWKPTGRAAQEPTPADSSELQHSASKQSARAAEREWQKERQETSQPVENAQGDHDIVENESEAQLGAVDEQSQAGGDDDIWAEEASRSLEEDVGTSHLSQRSRQLRRQPHHQKSARAEHLNELFSGQQSKPPRGKIPRTWRRSSGMDFTYSDSPAHSFAQDEPNQEDRKDNASDVSDGAGGGDDADQGSGVLTPPSTDEDDEDDGEDEEEEADEPGRVNEGASRSIFEPDAAATELQFRENGNANDVDEESDGSAISPDGDDTGLFWQNNLPSVYKRPARPRLAEQRKAKDLSSLLKDDDSSRIEKKPSPELSKTSTSQPAKRFPGSRLLAARREAASSSFTSMSSGEQSQTSKQNVVSSPLRKSLLKSSKIGGAVTAGELAKAGAEPPTALDRHTGIAPRSAPTGESTLDASTSFASKASDQRQLLEEAAATPQARQSGRAAALTKNAEQVDESLWHAAAREEEIAEASSPAQSVDYSAASEAQYTDDYESEEDDIEPSEEGHQERIEASEHIADITRSYEEHLNVSSPQKIRVNFGDSSTTNATGNSSLLQPKRAYPPLFSNQGPPSRGQPIQQEHILIAKPTSNEPGFLTKLTSTFWSAIVRPSGPAFEPVFPASLRTKLRSRYGVLSAQHPWTFAHMRTLHRMLNSCSSGKADSLVPQPGTLDLPSSLLPLAGRKAKDACGRTFVLSEQLAHVVWALVQTLVSEDLVAQMDAGEIDFIGDSMAEACRGYFDEYEGKPRHGDDVVFKETEIVRPKPRAGDAIGVDWVVRCLGACVLAQRAFEEIEKKRRAWEVRNGMNEVDESEVLPRVRRA